MVNGDKRRKRQDKQQRTLLEIYNLGSLALVM